MKNSNFLTSAKHAVDGFFYALKTERNLRFHLCIANLICLFAIFFKISRVEWAILFLAISSVISAEVFNTATENSVDTATKEQCESAKHSKDAAAAAVLVRAIFAVICGICIFGDLKKIKLALTSIIDFGFSGVFEFLLLFSILLFNIWLLFFCSRKKG